MMSRASDAAQTRRALLGAAAGLLEEGGPAAVTLRAVGERAGVSRGAPYGHFAGKAHLLAVLAAERWEAVRDELDALAATDLDAEGRLRAAVHGIVTLGIRNRSTYELMFTVPEVGADLVAGAAAQAQEAFIALVADVVGQEASRRNAALLMAGAHGIAGMSANGHLRIEKWGLEAPELVETLVSLATRRQPR